MINIYICKEVYRNFHFFIKLFECLRDYLVKDKKVNFLK